MRKAAAASDAGTSILDKVIYRFHFKYSYCHYKTLENNRNTDIFHVVKETQQTPWFCQRLPLFSSQTFHCGHVSSQSNHKSSVSDGVSTACFREHGHLFTVGLTGI